MSGCGKLTEVAVGPSVPGLESSDGRCRTVDRHTAPTAISCAVLCTQPSVVLCSVLGNTWSGALPHCTICIEKVSVSRLEHTIHRERRETETHPSTASRAQAAKVSRSTRQPARAFPTRAALR